MRVLSAIGHGIRSVFVAIGHTFTYIWSKSRIVGVAILAALLIGCVVVLDTAFTSDRIYKGVSVGDVDVSNLTVDEAADQISTFYTPRLYATSVYIFADEETANAADLDLQMIESDALAEQLSFEEAQANKKLWITSAQALEAVLPARELAEQAFAIGRDDGIVDRFKAAMGGMEVPVYASFNETLLGNLISDINATLGYPVVDFGVAFEDGKAHVTEGSTGYVLNDDAFTGSINEELLRDESPITGFVAKVEYTPYKIDREAATRTCDAINAVLPEQVTFESDGKPYSFSRQTMSEWIGTDPVASGDSYMLSPYVNRDAASHDILSEVNQSGTGSGALVSFIQEGDETYVQPDGEVAIPDIDEALGTLDASMFDSYRSTSEIPSGSDISVIPIQTHLYSGRLSVEDALSYGLVTKFSVFTTQYTSTASTANRTFNIHLAADRISYSIAKANGGEWSFNDVAGPCDEANGFKEAGVIDSGEYTTGIGGGICQVATTVFNAVYAAGLPINERHNHSLYSASYPAGRDAAIAYPTLDLKWTNDTSSDILLRTSHTDNSVTVSLIGNAVDRSVSTDTGNWIDGAKHSTRYDLDEGLAANESYVKIAGTDGMSITVKRTVKDADGTILENDTFKSTYSPITRVIAYGEGTDMTALREKYAETPKTTTSTTND